VAAPLFSIRATAVPIVSIRISLSLSEFAGHQRGRATIGTAQKKL
jgi:hypothetical protein